MRALVRRPKPIADSLLVIGDLTLHTGTFAVERSDQKITLTGKEFSLLEYLMRHPGQTLTKEQIIAHVWNYESNILPNTVEVNIRNIRQKIDAAFSASIPLIHTKRGFGYTIEA